MKKLLAAFIVCVVAGQVKLVRTGSMLRTSTGNRDDTRAILEERLKKIKLQDIFNKDQTQEKPPVQEKEEEDKDGDQNQDQEDDKDPNEKEQEDVEKDAEQTQDQDKDQDQDQDQDKDQENKNGQEVTTATTAPSSTPSTAPDQKDDEDQEDNDNGKDEKQDDDQDQNDKNKDDDEECQEDQKQMQHDDDKFRPMIKPGKFRGAAAAKYFAKKSGQVKNLSKSKKSMGEINFRNKNGKLNKMKGKLFGNKKDRSIKGEWNLKIDGHWDGKWEDNKNHRKIKAKFLKRNRNLNKTGINKHDKKFKVDGFAYGDRRKFQAAKVWGRPLYKRRAIWAGEEKEHQPYTHGN